MPALVLLPRMVAPIDQDVFTAEVEPHTGRLENLEIMGPADITPRVGTTEAVANDRYMVSTVLRVDMQGAPLAINLAVYRRKRLINFQACRLFPGATVMIQLDVYFMGFQIPPSQLWSDWRDSIKSSQRKSHEDKQQAGRLPREL